MAVKNNSKRIFMKKLTIMCVVIITLLLAVIAVIATIISGEVISLEKGKVALSVVMILLSGATAYLSAKQASHKRLLTALAASVAMVGALLLIKLMFLSTHDIGLGGRLYGMLLAALPAGVVASKQKTRRR